MNHVARHDLGIAIGSSVILPVAAALALVTAPALTAPIPLAAQSTGQQAAPGSGRSADAHAEGVRAAHLLGEALQREAALPGLAIAVGKGDQIVFTEGFGVADLETLAPVTPFTRWRIGSIGKSLTAAGAVLLAERGQLDLDATVADVLPAWANHPGGVATVRQLAGHLGGIRHYRDGEGISHTFYEDVTDALALFADDSLVAVPGAEYSYSTHGYTLLSALIQKAAGTPFLDWMDGELFRPLGMRQTGPDLVTAIVPGRASFYEFDDGPLVHAPFTDNSYKWAGGGFLSTPEDLVRFGTALLRGRLLEPAGMRSLFTSQRTSAGEETGYGMGFRPREDWQGRRVVHHGGSSEGGRAFLLLYPDRDIVVAMAANRSTAPLFEEEAQSLAHFFLDHGAGGPFEIDDDMAGGWKVDGVLGDATVSGSLRLFATGIRGILDWGEDRAPIRIVLVDRHHEALQLFGVGPHGVMNMWLEPVEAGWGGRWEYLGREGRIELAATPTRR